MVLHYDSNQKVDSVNIVMHKGDQNGTAAKGLNLTVTGSGRKGDTVNNWVGKPNPAPQAALLCGHNHPGLLDKLLPWREKAKLYCADKELQDI